MNRGDIDERYLVRLGAGERELDTDSTHDFTKAGRVAYSLHRRGILLEQVQLLSEILGLSTAADRAEDGSSSYTCETAEYFYRNHVLKRIRHFDDRANAMERSGDDLTTARVEFPFARLFDLPSDPLPLEEARDLMKKVVAIFEELEECRPLELLRSQRQRTDYLIMKQARVVAMTCTHAALARSHLIKLGFRYDNVVVEEAGQMTEIETFVPLLLQGGDGAASNIGGGSVRLKRVCLMGDHNQLPPVIKNMTFAHHCNLDQSMFARMIRLGVPSIQLDRQGRARPEIARLYSWRYENLGNLEIVETGAEYTRANPGFVNTYQLINVEKFQGKGEQTPTAYFYQNVGEAEYAVALFQFMVLIGYPPSKISILTTYNGQRALISDILAQRCGEGTPLSGVRPRAVSTVDQYQGQQNDYIILSLVRTESVGHLRDIRRLVVAVSRSRLGLYILCRQELFEACHELRATFQQLTSRPTKLQLLLDENFPTDRLKGDEIPSEKVFYVEDVTQLGTMVFQMQEQLIRGNED
jgi:intron-binding protein aquarius